MVARAAAPGPAASSRATAAPGDDATVPARDDLGFGLPAGRGRQPELGALGEGAIARTPPAPRWAAARAAPRPQHRHTRLRRRHRARPRRAAGRQPRRRGNPRPHLQLVRPTTPPARRSRRAADDLARRRAARRATGGAIEQGEGGLQHGALPAAREVSTTQQPFTISRELDDRAHRARHSRSTCPRDIRPTTAGRRRWTPKPLYEYFLDRFKRDLLIEREQLGHLIIDNP